MITMTSKQNGTEVRQGADLIPMPQPDLAASAPNLPPGSSPPRSSVLPQPGLAELTRRERARRRMRRLAVSAEYRMQDRVRHPDGGHSSVEELIAAEKAQRAQIEHETADGSGKHRRVPRWIGWIPRMVLCFDFGLLLYFFGGITNVDWTSPWSTALGFALILAAMVALLSYGYLAFTGHRLRGHKSHAGTVHPDEFDGFTWLIVAFAVVVITVIATLMYVRMHAEVGYALGSGAGLAVTVIAIVLAVITAAANFLVVAIHALDGSDQVERLERLSAAVRRPYAKAQRMREEAATLHAHHDN
jgi:uncharacterized membrane protein